MRDLDLIRTALAAAEQDDAAAEAARSRLRTHISAGGPQRRRGLRRRAGMTAALLVLTCGTAAAGGLLLSSDQLDLDSVACLDRAATLAQHRGTAVFVEPSADPVAACAAVWEAGHLDGARSEAPTLVACASRKEPVVVIPGSSQTCRELRLEPLPDDFRTAAADVGRAKAVLVRDWDLRRPASRCDDPEASVQRARGLLSDAGIRGVSVKLAGEGPCAGPPDLSSGAQAEIETLSVEEAQAIYERRIADVALDPLLAARSECATPRGIVARAEQLLAEEGLEDTRVRVDGASDACVDLSGYAHDGRDIVFATR